jgi:flagellar biosynthesis protein FlhF
MQVHTFIAASALEAVEQIRRELGPQAVVLNVRQLPAEGLARLWQKPRIEVLATLPEPAAAPQPDALAQLRHELAEIKERVSAREGAAPISPVAPPGPALPAANPFVPPAPPEPPSAAPAFVERPAYPERASVFNDLGAGSPLAALLENSGLARVHVQRVLDRIHQLRPEPPTLAAELEAARAVLVGLWPRAETVASAVHVFIGPPGVGKTTALSKWLAQQVLIEGRRAQVWRLDAHVANTAESLSVFAEILGVPVERFQPEQAPDPAELVFVDLPGVDWRDPAAVAELGSRLQGFAGMSVHLVLNAAYEGTLLVAQGRAFQGLPVTDVILTHLDEEIRWGKLWNFVLGTNYRVRFVSAGQNLPGDFQEADPERMLGRFLPGK